MTTETGPQVYERLEREGALKGNDGKDIWIHPGSRLYVIGDGATAAEALRRRVEEVLGQIPGGSDEITSTFYSRRIGELQRHPEL